MARAVSTVEDEVLCRDVFPAQAVLPGGRLIRNAHVFVTTNRIQVWTETAGGSVHVEHEAEITEFVVPSRNTLSLNGTIPVETEDGTISVSRQQGCGCSQRHLKALAAAADWMRR